MPSKGRADIVQASDPVPVIYTTFCKLLLQTRTMDVPRDSSCSTAAPVILCLDPLAVSSVTHSAVTGALATKGLGLRAMGRWVREAVNVTTVQGPAPGRHGSEWQEEVIWHAEIINE